MLVEETGILKLWTLSKRWISSGYTSFAGYWKLSLLGWMADSLISAYEVTGVMDHAQE